FTRRASAESGVESIVAFRLFADGDTLGALNLYATDPDAFEDHDVAVGAVLATHASVAWKTARTIENLEAAVESRQMIGEAVGLIMARQGVSEDEAFAVLQRASQRMNVKLRLIADQLVHPADRPPEAG
ncbi:MAG: GAF and ANTAR domain-containing protein, partial [Sciscionella sp.]